MLRRVVLEALKHFEALEGGAGPGHPVLDLDKEIRMLSCKGWLREEAELCPEDALGTECFL